MYKYTVSQGRDSDISKIASNTVFMCALKRVYSLPPCFVYLGVL